MASNKEDLSCPSSCLAIVAQGILQNSWDQAQHLAYFGTTAATVVAVASLEPEKKVLFPNLHDWFHSIPAKQDQNDWALFLRYLLGWAYIT